MNAHYKVWGNTKPENLKKAINPFLAVVLVTKMAEDEMMGVRIRSLMRTRLVRTLKVS